VSAGCGGESEVPTHFSRREETREEFRDGETHCGCGGGLRKRAIETQLMITFTALSGGAGLDSSSAAASSAFCYLLQLDNVSILLDCGIACPDDRSDSHPLAKLSSTVDLVLFSHPDAAHTGLYPYARTHWNLLAPAYATLPVQSLAKVALDDECEGEGREAFDAISPLRFTQPSHLQGKCTGLTITPFNAGHSLGGTLWKIRSPSAGTILYAVQLNHLKERTLDGTVLLKSSGAGGGIQVFEPLARPDLLITDAARTLAPPTRRKDRESRLLDVISSTLGSRHSILIPTALGSRLLELLLLLDQHWEFARLRYPLCMVAKNGKEMLDVVRSLMEWFGGKVGEGVVAGGGVGEALSAATSAAAGHKRKRDDEKDSPLRFRHLEFFPNPAALVQRYSSRDPKLILAAPLSMATGPSRSIFAELGLANGDGNVVILTQNGAGESVTPSGESLRSLWLNGQDADVKGGQKSNVGQPVRLSGPLTLNISSKEPLTGAELEEHLAAEKAKAEAAQALERETIMLQADVESSDSDSESDDDSSEDEDEPTVNGDDDTRMSSPLEDSGPMAEPGGGHPLSRRKSKRTKEEMAYMKMQMALDDENFAGFTGTGTRVQNFDTYLKDAGSRNRSFFKSALLNEQANANQGPGQQSSGKTRFKMFPFYERRRKADPYGEEIDVGTWLRRGKELEDQQNQGEEEEPNVDSVAAKGGAKV
jgi:cleavage and polyadenylation specificity factor subunit 2